MFGGLAALRDGRRRRVRPEHASGGEPAASSDRARADQPMTRSAFALAGGRWSSRSPSASPRAAMGRHQFSGPFNPDEAELLAAGRRAATQLWLPMVAASANTYFPCGRCRSEPWTSWAPDDMQVAHLLSACLPRRARLDGLGRHGTPVGLALPRRSSSCRPPSGCWSSTPTSGSWAPSSSVVLLALGAVIAFPPGNPCRRRASRWWRHRVAGAVVQAAIGPAGGRPRRLRMWFRLPSRDGTWTRENGCDAVAAAGCRWPRADGSS